jgi:hypothetical protein
MKAMTETQKFKDGFKEDEKRLKDLAFEAEAASEGLEVA